MAVKYSLFWIIGLHISGVRGFLVELKVKERCIFDVQSDSKVV